MPLRTATLACLLLAMIAVSGCKRSFYRRQADQDVNCLLDQKAIPAGAIPGQSRLPIDPRSRMYDPYDPDCEPMPPDDPMAARYLKCVDGKKGSADWKNLPRTPYVDNPRWQQYLPRDEQGNIAIDQKGAFDLALLHSPDYQTQIEELYLTALDVTFERFRFDTQFFGGSETIFTADGRDRSGLPNGSSRFEVSPARPGNRWRAERLTATGGELVVGLANSLVWQFAGPNNYDSTTLLDFSIVQPLLRAGGRTVVLERLTFAERSLLSNVRQMERFRRGFYVAILAGRAAAQGPSRRSVGGAGGFVNIGGTGVINAGGYIGLLQDLQELRNQRANVAALRASVVQLEATFEAERIDRFQVDLARQALFNAQSALLASETRYQSSVERFQGDIGLPPELEVAIRDPLLDRFNLLDPSLEALKGDVAQMLDLLRERRYQLAQAGPDEPVPTDALAAELVAANESIERLITSTDEQLLGLEEDFAQLDQALPLRRDALEQLATRPEVKGAAIDPSVFSSQRLDEYIHEKKNEQQRLIEVFAVTKSELDSLIVSPAETPVKQLHQVIRVLGRTEGELLELSLLQASVRLESVTIQPIELAPPQALAIASTHRRDWKNARATLVDSWRQIYFSANALESNLDLIFSGDIGNVGQNPFDLRGSNGRLRVGVQFDAPLTRLGERNAYRQAQINYQRTRRGYYEFRDQINLQLRNELRQLRLDEINLELRRVAVQLAISQVDVTQLRLIEPPKPNETKRLSSTTARDLVQSLSALLNVQNDFLRVWVDYEVQQLSLELDLGVMELDSNGMRIETETPYTSYLTGATGNPSDLHPGRGGAPMMEFPEIELVPTIAPEMPELRLMPGVELPGKVLSEPEKLPVPPAPDAPG